MPTSPAQPSPPVPSKRSTQPARALFSPPAAGSSTWVKRRVDASHLQTLTFGRPNRPSTPIYGVITGQYGREAEQRDSDDRLRRQRRAERAVKDKDVKAQHTLASLGHMKMEKQADKERFVMARFGGVDKRVVTRWDAMPGRRGDKADKQASVEESKEQITQ